MSFAAFGFGFRVQDNNLLVAPLNKNHATAPISMFFVEFLAVFVSNCGGFPRSAKACGALTRTLEATLRSSLGCGKVAGINQRFDSIAGSSEITPLPLFAYAVMMEWLPKFLGVLVHALPRTTYA